MRRPHHRPASDQPLTPRRVCLPASNPASLVLAAPTIAFGVDESVISRTAAPSKSPSQASRPPLSDASDRTRTPCALPTARASVSPGLARRARTETPAPSSTSAQSVERPTMEPPVAASSTPVAEPAWPPGPVPLDPRKVTTPLDVDRIEDVLRTLGILSDWQHVVDGLRRGFHVGATAPIQKTVLHPNHGSSQLVCRRCHHSVPVVVI